MENEKYGAKKADTGTSTKILEAYRESIFIKHSIYNAEKFLYR